MPSLSEQQSINKKFSKVYTRSVPHANLMSIYSDCLDKLILYKEKITHERGIEFFNHKLRKVFNMAEFILDVIEHRGEHELARVAEATDRLTSHQQRILRNIQSSF